MAIQHRIGIASLAAGLATGAWLSLPLRLADPRLNHIAALLLIWAIPLSLGSASICLLKRRWLRIAATALCFVLASLIPLALLISMVGGGPVPGFEVVDSLQLRHSRVVAYRIDGGATMDFAIRIVQEMPVFPGVVLVKDLHNGYHESVATLRATGPNSVTAVVEGRASEYRVRDFVFF